jgi:F0F1-type ATP synthase alpha subunit
VAILFAALRGLLDDLAPDQVLAFEQALLLQLRSREKELLTNLGGSDKLSEAIEQQLTKVVEQIKAGFSNESLS